MEVAFSNGFDVGDDEDDGFMLGINVGFTDGLSIGEDVGATIGKLDGEVVGLEVGEFVGLDVGERVGRVGEAVRGMSQTSTVYVSEQSTSDHPPSKANTEIQSSDRAFTPSGSKESQFLKFDVDPDIQT